jgi:hypothetical protein
MRGGDLLGNHSTKRKAKKVNGRQVQCVQELDTIKGECGDGRRRCAGGATDAWVVERDRVAVSR